MNSKRSIVSPQVTKQESIELYYRYTTNDIDAEGLGSRFRFFGGSPLVQFMLTLTDNPHSLPAFRYYSPKPKLIEDQTELCLRWKEQMRLYRMTVVKRLFRDPSPFRSAVRQIRCGFDEIYI